MVEEAEAGPLRETCPPTGQHGCCRPGVIAIALARRSKWPWWGSLRMAVVATDVGLLLGVMHTGVRAFSRCQRHG